MERTSRCHLFPKVSPDGELCDRADLDWLPDGWRNKVRFMVLGVRIAFGFVHITPFTDGALTGRLREQVAAVPYVAWESAMTVFAPFCRRLFTDEVPVETVHKNCLMQRRFLSITPFLWLTSTYQAFGPYTMAMRIPFSNFLSSGRQAVVSDTEVRYNSKVAPVLLSNMVDHIVQLVVM